MEALKFQILQPQNRTLSEVKHPSMADDNSCEAIDPDQRPIPLHQNDTVRFKIVLSYWLIVIIGLPLWWASTSIERLRLPKTRILALSETKDQV